MEQTQFVSDSTAGKIAKATLDLGLPGFSLYVDKELKQGLIHSLLGVAAGAAFGVPGLLLVSANSIARANSGKHLWQLGKERVDAFERARAEEDEEHSEPVVKRTPGKRASKR